MRRIKLTVAYDGTAYKGWQLQPNGVTIEEMLNKALSDLLKEPVCVIGASRTDSGVHARGNVADFRRISVWWNPRRFPWTGIRESRTA